METSFIDRISYYDKFDKYYVKHILSTIEKVIFVLYKYKRRFIIKIIL